MIYDTIAELFLDFGASRLLNSGIYGAGVYLAYQFAKWMGKSLHARSPELKTYFWGFFFGAFGVLCWAYLACWSFYAGFTAIGDSSVGISRGIGFLALAYTYFLIVRRDRWAWIIGNLILLNPIIWFFNGIYLTSRWREMDSRMPIPTEIFEKIQKYAPVAAALGLVVLLVGVLINIMWPEYLAPLRPTFKPGSPLLGI